ncbi:MAG: NAD(P)/FAD-dependent oxidoreductase [Prevotella sp.]|nr:NAD(P)/FAD-dependent oxidoreductase [Prevotella sp.]
MRNEGTSIESRPRRCAVVGGGAAGFFLALNLKEMCPEMQVTILERSQRVLAKVAISGGGRCNCTNSFAQVRDLSEVYPRGHRLLKRLFHLFGPRDAYEWFERHGVQLTTQDDECVFPSSQDSKTIIDCFLNEARRHGIDIRTGTSIQSLDELQSFDYVAITTGGQPKATSLQWLADAGHEIEQPVPSLFTFNIDDERLRSLMGTVCEHASLMLPQTKFRSTGPLLVTHWGLSGPATLKLSSHAARWLHEHNYQSPISINWTGMNEAEVASHLSQLAATHSQKLVSSVRPFDLSARLWSHLIERSLDGKADARWAEIGKKHMNRLVNTLCNDTYLINGRAPFKDEFVTCGGVSLNSVVPQTLESRSCPHLYFAGEILDIDGVTGGFNFQAAWTTAYTVANAISKTEKDLTQ